MQDGELFDRTRRAALQLAGLSLGPRHRELLERRSRRAGLDDARLAALLGEAESGDPEARARLIGLVTTHFTGFFRHPWHFELAAEHALWAAQRRGTARLWSAAASTGEEPYSLAIAVMEIFRRDDPPARILATDIDAPALETARQGEYAESALVLLGPDRRDRFFTDPAGPGRRRVGAAVRRLVEFREGNLAGETSPGEGPFDVVFCRNVLMYLEETRREAALERVISLLAPGGLLLLDPAEHLGRAARRFSPGERGAYVLRERKP